MQLRKQKKTLNWTHLKNNQGQSVVVDKEMEDVLVFRRIRRRSTDIPHVKRRREGEIMNVK